MSRSQKGQESRDLYLVWMIAQLMGLNPFVMWELSFLGPEN